MEEKKPHPLGWALGIAKVKKFPSPNLTLWELPVSLPRIPPPGELRLLKREEGVKDLCPAQLAPLVGTGEGFYWGGALGRVCGFDSAQTTESNSWFYT